MTLLRRYSAFVAALLLAVVAVQMLDMGLCCEPGRSASSPVEAETEVLLGEGGASSDLLVSGEEGRERGYAMQPDCLCHLVFVSTGTASALQAVVIPISTVPEAQASPYSAPLAPPGHIPLA